MKISICLPYMKPEFDRGRLQAWCQLADGGEFASISCGERIIDSSHDMRCLMAAAAALTVGGPLWQFRRTLSKDEAAGGNHAPGLAG